MKIKKCLVILLCTLFLGGNIAEARTTVSAGAKVTGAKTNKNKFNMSNSKNWKFTGTNTFMYGVILGVDYDLATNMQLGGYAEFLFGNKKQAYKTDASAAEIVAGLGLEDLDGGVTAVQQSHALKVLSDNKALFHRKIKNLIMVGVSFKYKVNPNFNVGIGLGYARLDAKYKFASSVNPADFNLGTTVGAANHVTAYQMFVNSSGSLIKKPKKNGFDVRAIASYIVANNVNVGVDVGYALGMKVLHYGINVAYAFNM